MTEYRELRTWRAAKAPASSAALFELFGLTLAAGAAGIFFLVSDQFVAMNIAAAAFAVSSAAAMLARAQRNRATTPTAVFYFILILFHFGLSLVFVLTGSVEALGNDVFDWYYDERTVTDCYVTCILFCSTFLLATYVPWTKILQAGRPAAPARISVITDRPLTSYAFYLVVAAWTIAMLLTGIRNYADYLTILDENRTAALIAGTSTTVLTAFAWYAFSNSQKLVGPLVALGLWATAAFAIGLRSPAIFCLTLVLPVMIGQRRVPFNLPAIVIVGAASLFVSSFVFNYRMGNTSVGDALASASVSRSIAELGGTLRCVFETHVWIRDDQTFRLGVSYWAPFERAITAIFPVVPRLAGEDDERLMGVLMLHRAGPFGFSMIAEAYVNFGLAGAAIIGAFFGGLVRELGRRLVSGRAGVIATAMMFALIVHIRQSFATAFSFAAVFLLVSLAIEAALRFRRIRIGLRSADPARRP